jgi:hypothetical protein
VSFNRDGVVWRVEWSDGHGYRYGQYSVDYIGGADGDPEWDVEVLWHHFAYVSPIHATPQDAFHAFDGSNPGGYTFHDTVDDHTAEYDRMAEVYETAERERRRHSSIHRIRRY